MTDTIGRREANKLATRQALQGAADRLFEKHGYSATTVRDISDAAGVTERTFFRYFRGKEDLIVDDALKWLSILQDGVRDRPKSEDPVTALRRAVLSVASQLSGAPRPSPYWMFSDGPSSDRISRSTLGPVLEAEAGLANVIKVRLEYGGNSFVLDSDYLAQILARTTIAIVRCALIRAWQLRKEGRARRPSPATLINQAFSVIQVPVVSKKSR